ncbi:MAG: hypothetical protein II391_02775, partial [Kiritimatiellae bacterium]|nr:hypothetical protein [Kiritimatiellia bacterium]
MLPNSTVGSYRIVRRIGVGGMGEVFEVEHLALGTRYALKTFVLESGDAAFLRERFLAEGRALARIEHPNAWGVSAIESEYGDGDATSAASATKNEP